MQILYRAYAENFHFLSVAGLGMRDSSLYSVKIGDSLDVPDEVTTLL